MRFPPCLLGGLSAIVNFLIFLQAALTMGLDSVVHHRRDVETRDLNACRPIEDEDKPGWCTAWVFRHLVYHENSNKKYPPVPPAGPYGKKPPYSYVEIYDSDCKLLSDVNQPKFIGTGDGWNEHSYPDWGEADVNTTLPHPVHVVIGPSAHSKLLDEPVGNVEYRIPDNYRQYEFLPWRYSDEITNGVRKALTDRLGEKGPVVWQWCWDTRTNTDGWCGRTFFDCREP
jgi:hypothetical protein